ncbi:hypothetical protein [Pseudomonas nitroreducens]|uniref:hypothetical protein n=1 Tax=Pseudomonas nitroreducens TaxID=46680 RepID=UPI002657C2C0|nr:hypothetical protein [Pseudomonas nitroreducens]MCP1651447.1 hypothetical protein [Pseudomonas nitroreducens]MCP1689327.1 hypothetical protein [Pseudomonas nitroreducens]
MGYSVFRRFASKLAPTKSRVEPRETPREIGPGGDAAKPAYRAGEYLESTLRDLLELFEKAEGCT